MFGIPSIGTRTGGIPEAVIDGVTGKLVEAESVDDLRNAIVSFLDDPREMARLGTNARERAMRFSWERSTDHVLQLLGQGDGEEKLVRGGPQQ
jgi:glycosyltransferase involved in cell wall biosynthesis